MQRAHTFLKVLELDHSNRQALSALGYLARDAGDTKLAESYFAKAAAAHPKDFAPYLALGDLFTSQGNFNAAEANYENAFQRMPTNALIIAGGANAAMESHDLNLRSAGCSAPTARRIQVRNCSGSWNAI